MPTKSTTRGSVGHTPGPWVATNGPQVWRDGHGALNSPRICATVNAAHPVLQLDAAEHLANARLIAQAPAMLEALLAFREWHANNFGDFSPETNAQLLCLDNDVAAIVAAAKGESK